MSLLDAQSYSSYPQPDRNQAPQPSKGDELDEILDIGFECPHGAKVQLSDETFDEMKAAIEALCHKRELLAQQTELKDITENYETQHTIAFGTVIRWSDINDRLKAIQAELDKGEV